MLFIVTGAVVWIQTGVSIALSRIAEGEPFVRALVIMFSVAIVTSLPLLLFQKLSTQNHFADILKTGQSSTIAFVAVFMFCSFPLAIVHDPIPLLAERFWPGAGWIEVFFLSCYAAVLVEAFLTTKSVGKLRKWIWLTFSIVFFSQVFLGLLGIKQCLMTGKLHLPVPALILGGPIFRGEGFFMPILFVSTIVLAGPLWCSWLCYFGSWDNLSASLHSGKISSPFKHPKAIQISMVLLTVLVALTLRMTGSSGYMAVLFGAGFGLAGIGIVGFVSRKRGIMTHCTSYCPIGLIATIAGKINPMRIKIDTGCCECSACTRVCNYGALTSRNLRNRKTGPTCTLCGDCTSVCNNKNIGFAFPGLSRLASRKLFFVVAVCLHTVFLGFGRL
jgi:ferredoxin